MDKIIFILLGLILLNIIYFSNLVFAQLPDSFVTVGPDGEVLGEDQLQKFTGIVNVWHADDFDNPENSRFDFYFISDSMPDKEFLLYSSVELPVVLSGTRIEFSGFYYKDGIFVDNGFEVIGARDYSGSISGFAVGDIPEEIKQDNIGEQKTLVVVVNIGENKAPVTVEEARHLVFDDEYGTAQDFYKKNSYGKAYFSGDVFGPYDLPMPEEECDDLTIRKFALIALKNDLTIEEIEDYGRLVIFAPPTKCDSAGGRGTVGKETRRLSNENEPIKLWRSSYALIYSKSEVTLEHELGHNFGVHHANIYNCYNSAGEKIDFSYDCDSEEYGDMFSIMGYGSGYHNAPHKKQIGWLDKENVIMVSEEGTYSLSPIETSLSPGIAQMIMLPLEIDTSSYISIKDIYYMIEFREPLDYDITLPRGISIRIMRFSKYETFRSNLLGKEKKWLDIDESFIDEINGYKISLEDISGSGVEAIAKVKIERIPKKEINLDESLVYYSFNEPFITLKRNVLIETFDGAIWLAIFLIKDNAGYLRGAKMVQREKELKNIRKEGGIYLDGRGLDKEGYHLTIKFNEFPNFLIDKNYKFSISIWANIRNLPITYGNIIKIGNFISLNVQQDGKIQSSMEFIPLVDDRRYTATISSIDPVNLGEWYHIVSTFDGELLKLYINGKEQGSTREGFLAEWLPRRNMQGGSIRTFGRSNHIGNYFHSFTINGVLDELKIYGRALSEDEILDLYNGFKPGEIRKSFIRGDANTDGRVDLSDSISILSYLFQNGEGVRCLDAGDSNDDRRVDISDAISILNYLFQGGKEPSMPYPGAGIDPTDDSLGCEESYDDFFFCKDSDKSEDYPDGLNYFKKGITRQGANTKEDKCAEEFGPSVLAEYSCNFFDEILENYYMCPKGCVDGACVQ